MIIKTISARSPVAVGGGPGPGDKRASDRDLGRSMRGLVSYLVGPGTANEHTNPTLVAGWEPLYTEFPDVRWDDPNWAAGEVSAIARQLNRPMLRKRIAGELPEDRAWVMHAVISMEPGTMVDESMWSQIARDYIGAMGWDGSDGKAECRWAAFHHGLTTEGNDHLHVAVMMIREDGTWASTWQSKKRTQDARRAIEQRYGLTPAEQAATNRDHVPYHAADHARAKQRATTPAANTPAVNTTSVNTEPVGARNTSAPAASARRPAPAVTDNERLRSRMLSALAQADTEAGYVRQLWSAGVMVRPRYAAGTTDVVTGYSVALRPATPDVPAPLWHAAGKVHRTLTLTAIRARFVDEPEHAAEAAAMWRRAHTAAPPTPRTTSARADQAAAAAAHLAEVNTLLADLAPAEVERWTAIARDTAGAWSAVADQLEPAGRGPLHQAAHATLRDGTTLIPWATPQPPHIGIARSVRLIAQAHRGDELGWLAVLEQLALTTTAIANARAARHDRDNATHLLARTHAALAHGQHLARTAHGPTPAQPPAASVDRANSADRDREQGHSR